MEGCSNRHAISWIAIDICGAFSSLLLLVLLHNCVQGKDTSDLKLDFTYDANLAPMPSGEKSESVDNASVDPPPPITMPPSAMMHRSTAVVSASVAELLPLQSPATDDLNLKIMSVKNVWEREHQGRTALEQIFEQRYFSALTLLVGSFDP